MGKTPKRYQKPIRISGISTYLTHLPTGPYTMLSGEEMERVLTDLWQAVEAPATLMISVRTYNMVIEAKQRWAKAQIPTQFAAIRRRQARKQNRRRN